MLKAQQTLTEKYNLISSEREHKRKHQAEVPGDNPLDIDEEPDAPWLHDFDVPMDEPTAPLPRSIHREYYEGAAKTYGRAQTFMGAFQQDTYAAERQSTGNIHYPFASPDEWQVASFLSRSQMSIAATDEFLKLRLVTLLLQ
jgi:hypothetical protein